MGRGIWGSMNLEVGRVDNCGSLRGTKQSILFRSLSCYGLPRRPDLYINYRTPRNDIYFTIFIISIMSHQSILLFLFAIVSGVGMSISQKFLSDYSPFLVNAVAQGVACIVFVVLALWFRGNGSGFGIHWAMIVLGLAFVGLNYGYSALYGQGVMLAYVPIIVTGGMTVLLGIV